MCVALSSADVLGISDGTAFWSETKPYRNKKGNDLEWMTGTDKKVLCVIVRTYHLLTRGSGRRMEV